MAEFNVDEVKKLKRGERIGGIALLVCAAAIVFFAICFPVARVRGSETLELATLIVSPVLLVAGAAVAAFCNLKYGNAIDQAVRKYVLDVFVENAAMLHPERSSLSFYLLSDGNAVILQVNGYREKIVFDFSAFGKLSPMRKLSVLTEIENRLCATFCRLYDRGANYRDVGFSEREGTRKKQKKTVYVIKDGIPDRKSYQQYLKNK